MHFLSAQLRQKCPKFSSHMKEDWLRIVREQGISCLLDLIMSETKCVMSFALNFISVAKVSSAPFLLLTISLRADEEKGLPKMLEITRAYFG